MCEADLLVHGLHHQALTRIEATMILLNMIPFTESALI